MEQWRPIPGYETFYEVSDLGNVRRHRNALLWSGRPVKQTLAGNGYRRVMLSKNGHEKSMRVHRLALLAFVGPPPTAKHQCNHKNGVKEDNRLENLEWATPKANTQHAFALGLVPSRRGERNNRSKLAESTVRAIRSLANVMNCREIARLYCISRITVREIKRGRQWKHVTAMVAISLISGCLAGCEIILKDAGEVGFRYGTEFTFFQRTSTTNATSVAESKSQPLSEWLARGAPQQTDAVTPTGSEAVPVP